MGIAASKGNAARDCGTMRIKSASIETAVAPVTISQCGELVSRNEYAAAKTVAIKSRLR
jgi:hypothetical protein